MKWRLKTQYKESFKQKVGSWKRYLRFTNLRRTNEKKEKIQINKIRNENGDITTNINEIHRMTGEYFKTLYSNELENLEEIQKFLDIYDLPKLTQEDINHLSRSVVSRNKVSSNKEKPRTRWIHC
jgi:predicted transcriptional regulator